MKPEEVEVARHYDDEALAYELARLEGHSPVEYAMTLRALARWAQSGGLAVELGVGSGAYSS